MRNNFNCCKAQLKYKFSSWMEMENVCVHHNSLIMCETLRDHLMGQLAQFPRLCDRRRCPAADAAATAAKLLHKVKTRI